MSNTSRRYIINPLRRQSFYGSALTLFALLLSGGAATAACTVPTTFVSGTTADASAVNNNFTAANTCINNVASGATRNAYYSGTPVNFTATSTSGAMGGLGASTKLTPAFSGRVKIRITGWTGGGDATTIVGITPMFGTGTAPAHNVATTGTAASPEIRNTGDSTASTGYSFSLYAEVTGLTIGTQYWFDLSTANGLGGSFNVTTVTQSIEEF